MVRVAYTYLAKVGDDYECGGNTTRWARVLTGRHDSALLNTLTAMRWDLENVLRDGTGYPAELSDNIGRVFEEIDASIKKLDANVRGKDCS